MRRFNKPRKKRGSTVGNKHRVTKKGLVYGGHKPGKAVLSLAIGGKTFSFDGEKLARVRKIREAKRAVSLPISTNGGGRS